jgi:7-cyano-7-deazaguanine synthase
MQFSTKAQDNKSMANALVIVSGGMDSVTLLHYLVKQQKLEPIVLSFQYGQKHERELEAAKSNVAELDLEHCLVDLRVLGDLFSSSALVSRSIAIPSAADVKGDPQPASYVPNRNMLFLAIAATYAESHGVQDIFYGAQKADIYGYWDTTPDFLEKLNSVYSLNRKNAIHIEAPFVQWTKTEILKLGLELGVDYAKTWSCYQGADKACGRCPTCGERLAAFAALNITDPLPYE